MSLKIAKVLKKLDRGAMGRVEKVELSDGTIAACKTFDPHPAVRLGRTPDEIEKMRKRFRREVKIQSELPGEFFVPILASETDGDEPWFIMPLAERSLEREIAKSRSQRKLPTAVLVTILSALDELHTLGFSHRDLKPANILKIDGHWKLADFGLASAGDAMTQLTTTNSTWGTMDYCAPEQHADFRSAHTPADIYSFGCILHDLVYTKKRTPYGKCTAPGPLGPIIEKCTETAPHRRFKSVNALRTAMLEALEAADAVPPRSVSANAKLWIARLGKLNKWKPSHVEDLVRYLNAQPGDSGSAAGEVDDEQARSAVFDAITEDHFAELRELHREAWRGLALTYTEYVQRTNFKWEFCDVLIHRLEKVFELGDTQSKALAAIAAACMAARHNRWFVMHRVVGICGSDLDAAVAGRIAIEIRAGELEEDFKSCVKQIKRTAKAFHPSISRTLEADD